MCPGFVKSPFLDAWAKSPEDEAQMAAFHPWNGLGRPEVSDTFAKHRLFEC